MGVVSRWMWVECIGVVVRRYMDFFLHIFYLSLLLLYISVLFLQHHPYILVHFLKCFFVLLYNFKKNGENVIYNTLQ